MARFGFVSSDWVVAALFVLTGFSAFAQQQEPAATQQLVKELLRRVEADEARIKQLEEKLALQGAGTVPAVPVAAPTQAAAPTPASPLPAVATPAPEAMASGGHDLMMTLPGGPQLKINGFADVNFGTGSVSNALIFPLNAQAKSAFQLGEFDLFISSQLAPHWSSIGELVIGSDLTNDFGIEIERLQLTYKASEYFSISAGRFHSAIGYYNTAFHHGTWFQTAEGRPFMFYFEDSGGVLPLHNLGLTATGVVPKTGKVGLHWIAEVGNGRTTNRDIQPVQNFASDRNRKAVNLAAFIQPEAVPGLQIGGSFYLDRMAPIPGVGRVSQRIGSVYAVFTDSNWEFLNEATLITDILPSGRSYHSPLAYSQISRKLHHIYRPYFRYQYVNVPDNDPALVFTGRYNGPSVGLRIDVTDYAAFKLQYNRVQQRLLPAANGLNAQLAFAF